MFTNVSTYLFYMVKNMFMYKLYKYMFLNLIFGSFLELNMAHEVIMAFNIKIFLKLMV